MALDSLFTQHSRSWQTNRYVYPVISRRARGLSIGVNLNPDKVCNFDCVYCCVDRTVPPVIHDVDLDVLRHELDSLLALAISGELFAHPPLDTTPPQLRRLNDVAFSGDGEPTACPQFARVCRIAAELLQRHGSTARIITITNSTLLHRPSVQEALAFLDAHNGEIWAKLDAGTEAWYRRIERTSVPFSRVLDNILRTGLVRPIVIQSLFLRYQGQGPDTAELDAYTTCLRDLQSGGCRIKRVQVYTVARSTADPTCVALPEDELTRIADQVRSATSLCVEVFPGTSVADQ